MNKALVACLGESEPHEWTREETIAVQNHTGLLSHTLLQKLRNNWKPYSGNKEQSEQHDDQKYGGNTDCFEYKLNIFNMYCSQLNISNNEIKAKAFPQMLKGTAFQFYVTITTNQVIVPTFVQICDVIRSYFEIDEWKRARLTEFNSTTLKKVISNNPTKSLKDSMDILVDKLQQLQLGLASPFRTDSLLCQTLILACAPVEACQFACIKPSPTFPGLISELKGAVDIWQAAHPNSHPQQEVFTNQIDTFSPSDPGNEFVDEVDVDVFYIDRTYHGNRGRNENLRFGRRNSQLGRAQQYQQSTNPHFQSQNYLCWQCPKTCFVCKKPGCWSTKHTEAERADTKRKYLQQLGQRFDNNARQYILSIEGTEDEHDFNDFESFMTELNLDDNDNRIKNVALHMVSTMSNNSTYHAITHTIPANNPNPLTYTIIDKHSCYSSAEFYGIMIYAGSSTVSTSGYGQFLAYKRRIKNAATIDIRTAGSVNVQFGIGLTSTIGSLVIYTPIGPWSFI
ncbi:BgTH12-02819 [Blumeria graminis f. sp. triticale]|uniref:BgTH12-02819 n=1 Tax=Blumeria graminis f. sp. triticale TaxID=1689686 RepID=A0A9W4GGS4_BLUGR|nr:BgTH12-02819 [Blumeria graminis f. sp. triticale]